MDEQAKLKWMRAAFGSESAETDERIFHLDEETSRVTTPSPSTSFGGSTPSDAVKEVTEETIAR